MNTEQTQEQWQVDAQGRVWDTDFGEITKWIDEGVLLRQDKVRKGNLRWIEAAKVPSLLAVFNAKENGQPLPPPVVSTTKLGPTSMPGDATANPANYAPAPNSPPYKGGVAPVSGDGVVLSGADEDTPTSQTEPLCSVHADAPAFYQCTTCTSLFCKFCPNSYGGTVRICPMCGAMCERLARTEIRPAYDTVYHAGVGGTFGFGDFTEALAYPFKFKTSLVFGALMYMFFSLGQGAVSFGGIYMLGGALACFLMANTLTFGILANTVENFSQGKIGLNFMPTFDDFSIWDDVVHPFFLSIGVYISAFGPLLAVALLAFFMVFSSVSKEMNGIQSDAARTVDPGLSYAANSAQQANALRDLLDKQRKTQQDRVAAMENGEQDASEPPALAGSQNAGRNSTSPPPANAAKVVDASEDNVMRAQAMIERTQKAQAEAIVGKAPDTIAAERAGMIKKLLGYGALFVVLGGIALLWGLFYFPAACAVAGYTRSFAATLNPAVGFDTIRRLGVDYVKILLMGLVIVLISGTITAVVSGALSAFDLPGVGNLPARAIGSLFGFYFSVVFSCVIGFALYKAADRLKLPT
ncbi:hypothetical protein BH10ACI3_BH10ACI3_00530 [soil metagenome]